jgi:histone-lysine N-methyltransferase SETMAR
MVAVFWDRKGVLMVEFMQKGTIITLEVYCEALKNCIGPAIQNKRCGMLTSDVVILHDNACLHTSTDAHTRPLLKLFNWMFFDHPPYSPDVVPSDYRLLT